MKKILIATTTVFALFFSLFLIGCDQTSSLEYATIEINPGIDMVIENDRVQSVAALNQDGEVLLVNLSLENKTMGDAVEEIIDEAIDLGYIDPDTEGTTVEIDSTSEATMTKLQEKFNLAFQERGMYGKAVAKANAELIAEAEALGVTVGFLRLVYRVIEADDTILFEDALLMEQKDLLEILKNKNSELKMLARELKDEFFAERQLLFDEYLPQIEALEEQIATIEADGGDATDLIAELEALRTELHDLVTQLRETYQAEGEALRAQIQTRNQERIQQNQNAVEAFRNQMRQIARDRKEAIQQYQQQTSTTETPTTTENTGSTEPDTSQNTDATTNTDSTSTGGSDTSDSTSTQGGGN